MARKPSWPSQLRRDNKTSNFSDRLSAWCDCVYGYEGDRCQTKINRCKPNPCRNNATCEAGINAFQCHCLPGTKGKFCEEGELYQTRSILWLAASIRMILSGLFGMTVLN